MLLGAEIPTPTYCSLLSRRLRSFYFSLFKCETIRISGLATCFMFFNITCISLGKRSHRINADPLVLRS